MGKRSDFKRIERDFYPTPKEAVIPLLSHLPQTVSYFMEPCAGDGSLIKFLEELANIDCLRAFDIEPRAKDIEKKNALDIDDDYELDYIITNPPWNRKILHPMIEHFQSLLPTWLLFDADWMHTKQSIPFIDNCEKIVSVGRVKWIPDSKMTGKDNCCWYLFNKEHTGGPHFYGR